VSNFNSDKDLSLQRQRIEGSPDLERPWFTRARYCYPFHFQQIATVGTKWIDTIVLLST